MRIDKPREHDLVGGIDDEIAIRHGISSTTPNGDDVASLNHHPSIFDGSGRPVHRKHESVLDRDARH
jgi:hypothetical protein